MISAAEDRLIETMVDMEAEDLTIHHLCSALSEEQMLEADKLMWAIYDQNGEVTEDEMLRIMLKLTALPKTSSSEASKESRTISDTPTEQR